MSIRSSSLELFLGTNSRGAPDSLRVPLQEAFLNFNNYKIASQQFSDRALVNSLIEGTREKNGSAKVFIESDYLSERKPLIEELIWEGGGDYEENRQCFLALMRAGIKIRFDHVGSALQHANFIIIEESQITELSLPKKVIVTSANLAPGSIGRHFNWLAVIDSKIFAEVLEKVFQNAWDGDFQADPNISRSEVTDNGIKMVIGANGEVLEELSSEIQSANSSIELAFFNISSTSPLVGKLKDAAEREIKIKGIVDGDQKGQGWDAIPELRESGADIKYYPGVMTGAIGRMHYKMAVFDNTNVYLGTANISSSATKSLELGLFFSIDNIHEGSLFLKGIAEEITRLYQNCP